MQPYAAIYNPKCPYTAMYSHMQQYYSIYTHTHPYTCKYMAISEFGGRVLNGKCSARGPRNLSESAADKGKPDLSSVLLLLLLLLLD